MCVVLSGWECSPPVAITSTVSTPVRPDQASSPAMASVSSSGWAATTTSRDGGAPGGVEQVQVRHPGPVRQAQPGGLGGGLVTVLEDGAHAPSSRSPR